MLLRYFILFCFIQFFLITNSYAINLEFYQFTPTPGFNQSYPALKSDGHYPSRYKWIFTSSVNYVSNPISIKQDGERVGSLLDSLTSFHYGAAYRWHDSLQLGINSFVSRQYGNEYDQTFPGDLGLDVIWKFYEGSTHAIALQPRLTLPIS